MRSRTPYCHMVYENTRAKKDAVKLDIIRYAQQKGNKPAARRFGCSKNTVKLWRRRYEAKAMAGLEDQRKGPKNIPHKTTKAEEKKIIKCRTQAPCYGPKRLKWAYDIKASAKNIKENKI
jgi:transposase